MGSEIEKNMGRRWSLPAKQAETLAITATSVSEDNLVSQLSRWWDIKPSASNCDDIGRSKNEQRAIKTLQQTTRFTGEWYEVVLLWWEDEVKIPKNFYSAMVRLKFLEGRLQKDDLLQKRHQETIETDNKAGYVCEIE